MRRIQIIAISILTLAVQTAFATGGGNGDKYRVVAHKNGANTISISNTVLIAGSATVYVPNAFTPDGDGINDMFGAAGTGLNDYELQIFNRWGEQIFTSTNLDDQWDGNYQSLPVAEGVYVYKLFAMGDGGARTYKTGSVTLLR